MSSNRQLIDPTFLLFLIAGNPTLARSVQDEAVIFAQLPKYGWTPEELTIAAKTGYNYMSHHRASSSWKSQTNAGPLYDWLRHCHWRSGADRVDLSFDEFVALWCRLADNIYSFDGNRRYHSLKAVTVYVKALRAGLSCDEAWELALYAPHDEGTKCDMYIALRRKKISQKLANRLRNRYMSGVGDVKSIIEAHRKGASDDEIVEAVTHGKTHELALRYRKEARERRETS